MHILQNSAITLLLLHGASCVGSDAAAPDREPDYSNFIRSSLDAMRTKAANIALSYSKGSDSAEAIATAVLTQCASDIDEIVRMQVAQAGRGLTRRQWQIFLDGRPEERSRRQLRSVVYERAVADVIEFRNDASKH